MQSKSRNDAHHCIENVAINSPAVKFEGFSPRPRLTVPMQDDNHFQKIEICLPSGLFTGSSNRIMALILLVARVLKGSGTFPREDKIVIKFVNSKDKIVINYRSQR